MRISFANVTCLSLGLTCLIMLCFTDPCLYKIIKLRLLPGEKLEEKESFIGK